MILPTLAAVSCQTDTDHISYIIPLPFTIALPTLSPYFSPSLPTELQYPPTTFLHNFVYNKECRQTYFDLSYPKEGDLRRLGSSTGLL